MEPRSGVEVGQWVLASVRGMFNLDGKLENEQKLRDVERSPQDATKCIGNVQSPCCECMELDADE